jgi:hypothetical protein
MKFEMHPKFREMMKKRRTATDITTAYPPWQLLDPFDRDFYYRQHWKLLKDAFTLKPERSQEMACDVCNVEKTQEQETATKTKPPDMKWVCVKLDLTAGNKISKEFHACPKCYLKIKKEIEKIGHSILALSECEHTD